ncbi:MAG: hypothetical protein PHC39_04565 [Proteiniphilum sp.]|nr:hypothetical protein [Proteiniphilum sp.]
MTSKEEEIREEVAPKIRALAQKHGMNDSGIVEGVIQFIVIAVLIVFVPGILYVVSTGAISIPTTSTYYLAQQNVTTNVSNGVQTVGVIPTIFAIVLIIGVLMLLAMRR